MSNDSTSATKNHEHHFGYKKHTLTDELKFIENQPETPLRIYDSQIDLSFSRAI
jgi:hypothetical protein